MKSKKKKKGLWKTLKIQKIREKEKLEKKNQNHEIEKKKKDQNWRKKIIMWKLKKKTDKKSMKLHN